MKKLVILKIVDNETGEFLDTFLVKNPPQQALNGLQDLLDSRYIDDKAMNDWDYSKVYDYIYNNFNVIQCEHKEIEY